MINEGNTRMSSTSDHVARRRVALAVGAGALVLLGGAGFAYAASSSDDSVETGWATVVDADQAAVGDTASPTQRARPATAGLPATPTATGARQAPEPGDPSQAPEPAARARTETCDAGPARPAGLHRGAGAEPCSR